MIGWSATSPQHRGAASPSKFAINQHDPAFSAEQNMESMAQGGWVEQHMRVQEHFNSVEDQTYLAGNRCKANDSGEFSDADFLDPSVYETDEEVSDETNGITVAVRKRVFELEVVGKATYDVTSHGDCYSLEVRNDKSAYRIWLPFGTDWDFTKDTDSSLEDGVLTVVARKAHAPECLGN
jgi:hypothetical protein